MAMTDTRSLERRLLQACIIIGGCVPVFAGAAGMLQGAGMLDAVAGHAHDSHFRYLSGLLFAIGLGFWAAVPRIEARTAHVRLLTALVFAGGLARLAGALFDGWPPTPMVLAIGMELVVTPLLCLWQARIAKTHAAWI